MNNKNNSSVKTNTAHIIKSFNPRQIGFYVINGEIKSPVFFTRYRDAKDFCEARGWAAERCQPAANIRDGDLPRKQYMAEDPRRFFPRNHPGEFEKYFGYNTGI